MSVSHIRAEYEFAYLQRMLYPMNVIGRKRKMNSYELKNMQFLGCITIFWVHKTQTVWFFERFERCN